MRLRWAIAGVVAAGCAGTHPATSGNSGQGGSGTTSGAAGSGTATGAAGDDGGVIFQRYDGPPPSYDGAVDAPARVVGGAPLGDAACAAQTQKAEKLPLDMYVMLDSSSSMTDATASGASKWDAIRAALTTFLRDPASADIGVGLQYFPQTKPGVPDSCAANGDCGTSGPCDFVKGCTLGGTFCNTNADCTAVRNDTCVPLGGCTLTTDLCLPIGGFCGSARGTPRGNMCVALAGYCAARDLCGGASYATPAVEISPLPGSATGLVASLTGHMPDGLTPTSGALGGAIAHAQAYAKANAGHRVVALLATDGLPSECTPTDDQGIASIAASGLAGTPSVATFAIGVFSTDPTEQLAAHTTLDAIAAAGGTKQSFIINVGQNVEQQFLMALNSVRTAALSCEFKVPAATGAQALDYYAVNVQFTSGAGQTVTIGNVKNKAACDARQGGWYYDVDPATGTPMNISICDTSCTQLRGDPAGKVDVLVGCKTEVIIP